MDEYMQMRNYMSKRQQGFRGKRSCMADLLDFYDRVSIRLGKRKKKKRNGSVDCVFFYCRKVSDTVIYRRLVKDINFQSGEKGGLLQWIEKYISGWERTHVRETSLNLIKVSSGILQGSVVGSLLFLVYSM